MASLPMQSPPDAALGKTALPSQTRLEFLGKLKDGSIAVFMAFIAQLLIAGIQFGLDQEKSDFPAPILAMATVFLLFSISGCLMPGVDDFYKRRLKRPVSGMLDLPLVACLLIKQAELLNRHMSIGFTIPVVMLCHGPLSDTRSIGMIIICFGKWTVAQSTS
jgi:hypothetical protein